MSHWVTPLLAQRIPFRAPPGNSYFWRATGGASPRIHRRQRRKRSTAPFVLFVAFCSKVPVPGAHAELLWNTATPGLGFEPTRDFPANPNGFPALAPVFSTIFSPSLIGLSLESCFKQCCSKSIRIFRRMVSQAFRCLLWWPRRTTY